MTSRCTQYAIAANDPQGITSLMAVSIRSNRRARRASCASWMRRLGRGGSTASQYTTSDLHGTNAVLFSPNQYYPLPLDAHGSTLECAKGSFLLLLFPF